MKNTVKTTVFSLFLVIGAALVPAQAHADFNPFNPLDPFCLFSCDNTPSNVNNSINDSYNNNSNSFNTQNNTNGGSVYNGTPTYNYDGGGGVVVTTLSVNCYPSRTSAHVGQNVVWTVSIGGGNGNNYISWSGSEGLSGNGTSISKTYSYSGTKNASVYVTSGGQTASANCSSSVVVDGGYYNDYTPNYNYNNNYNYYNQYPNYNYYTLTVSCRPNVTYAPTGTYVYWQAYASGGSGSYNYTWYGTDNLYGSGSSASMYYNNPGVKSAWISVFSNGQTATAQCSNSVSIGSQYYYNQPTINYNQINYNYGLQVACAADTTSTRVGIPVTWTAEATNSGYSNSYYPGSFNYSWSGSEVYGSQQSAIVKYSTTGTKSAWVTVTSPTGQSITQKCSNSVTVKGNVIAAKPKPAQPSVTPIYVPVPQPPQPIAADSLFSLNNVPWGWVGVLIILVLLGIIFYLIFNKKKI